jgi:hypothetical protein
MSGRILRISRAICEPDSCGIVSSESTASKYCGSAAKAASASTLEV